MQSGSPVKKRLSEMATVFFITSFVILILAANLVPVFTYVRDHGHMEESWVNLNLIGHATLQYEKDHLNTYPPTDSMDHLKLALTPYLPPQSGTGVFLEPGIGVPYALNVSLSNKRVSSQGDPSHVVIAREIVPPWKGVLHALYGDGSVKILN